MRTSWMHSDRIFGLCVMGFGVFLLLFFIPAEIAEGRGPIDPARFPSFAAWLFIILGGLHTILSAPGISWPAPREAARVLAVFAITVAACLLMPKLGYIVTAIATMIALTILMFERRPHWVALTVAAVPLGLYAFFVLLLHRPLPNAAWF